MICPEARSMDSNQPCFQFSRRFTLSLTSFMYGGSNTSRYFLGALGATVPLHIGSEENITYKRSEATSSGTNASDKLPRVRSQ